jgi:hypothetical protein
MCTHEPQCPSAGDIGRAMARVIASRPEQGWSLLCNGIVFFDDGGLLLPTATPQYSARTGSAALGALPGGEAHIPGPARGYGDLAALAETTIR